MKNVYLPDTFLARIDRKTAELAAVRPFCGAGVQALERALEVEITFNSCAIEGSTLSLGETEAVLRSADIAGMPAADVLMARRHAAGWDLVKSWAVAGAPNKITAKKLLTLHRTVYEVVDVHARGVFRDGPVAVRGSAFAFPPPGAIAGHVERLLRWCNFSDAHPVLKAAGLHWGLVTIHPFFDGNGRTARLLQDFVLLAHGYSPAVVRSDERATYVKILKKSQTQGDIGGFIRYIANKAEITSDRYRQALGLQSDTEYRPLAVWAKAFGVTPAALRTQALHLRLAAFKRGGEWFATKTEIDAYMQSRQRQRASSQVVEGTFVAYVDGVVIVRTKSGLREIPVETIPKNVRVGTKVRIDSSGVRKMRDT